MGRVQVWASQLWANDFPPVCAMTGRPAETWRKFKFSTPPQWTYALLILICLGGLGLIAYIVVIATVSQRASGHLPLTRTSSRTVALAWWVPTGLLIACATCWLVAAIIAFSTNDPSATTVAGVLFWIGLLTLFAGLVGRLVVKPLVCPRAKVMEMAPGQNDRIVELRNVHPTFIAAVQQHQNARFAQASAPQPPLLPGST